jgi:transposase
LLDGFTVERVIADRGYAAADLIAEVQERGSEAVIPPHQRAKLQRDYERGLYRERHLIECCINNLKHFRRLFSRFDKLDRSGSLVSGLCPLCLCAHLVTLKCQQNLVFCNSRQSPAEPGLPCVLVAACHRFVTLDNVSSVKLAVF